MTATVGTAQTDAGPDICIDPHIAAMFPEPSPREYAEMERVLRIEGCRTPISVWAGCSILLDDPGRLSICRHLGIPFTVEMHPLTDRSAAEAFVACRLLALRNLTPEATAYYRGKRYLDEKRRHGGARRPNSASGQSAHLRTAERLGKEYGLDERTIRRDAKFTRALDEIAANCGPRAAHAILARRGGLRRRTVLRLAALDHKEQGRIMQLVFDRGYLPRGSLPAKQRTIVLPVAPKALGRQVFRRLGIRAARIIACTIRRLLIRVKPSNP